jgi:hypothetical protein
MNSLSVPYAISSYFHRSVLCTYRNDESDVGIGLVLAPKPKSNVRRTFIPLQSCAFKEPCILPVTAAFVRANIRHLCVNHIHGNT